MRRALFLITVVLLALVPVSLLADPGAGTFTCNDGTAADVNGKNRVCTYEFTDTTDSELIVADLGPWEFCFDPDIATDALGTGTVSLRRVDGTSDTTNHASAVNGLVLTGDESAGLRCIYQLGAGRYWVDVIGDPGAADAIVVFRHM